MIMVSSARVVDDEIITAGDGRDRALTRRRDEGGTKESSLIRMARQLPRDHQHDQDQQ